MADCKKALVETAGDVEKATEYLRKKGLAAAAKKQGRIATEGVVASYIHSNNRVGVLLEVNCETDFVARGEAFSAFAREVSLQIAAMNPLHLDAEEIPADAVEKERAIRLDRPSSRASRRASSARSSTARSPSGKRRSACSIRPGSRTTRSPSATSSTSSSARSARTARSAASRATSWERAWRRRKTTSPRRSRSRRACERANGAGRPRRGATLERGAAERPGARPA
jgi:hypothetical protein